MLRGIPDIIGSDLLKALADTGHGDLIVIGVEVEEETMAEGLHAGDGLINSHGF